MAAWEHGLNPEQRAAIVASGHCAVIAGPGTGKTRTILGRALRLVECGIIAPEKLRIVNFTNAGVYDLKQKIQTSAEWALLRSDSVTTFHSLALSCLRRSAEIKSRPIILDEWEETMFIDTYVKDRLGLKNMRAAQRARSNHNARWCRTIDELDDSEPVEQREYEVAYRETKQALGFLTRGELTFLWWKHLRSMPGAYGREAGLDFDALLVDEYQDLNECEHDILNLLASLKIEIFAVGDPNQCIYESMRHAHPEFCAEFPIRLPHGTLHVLSESYRCPSSVLEVGRALMSGAVGIPDPRKARSRGEARVLRFTRDTDEVSGVVSIAAAILQSNPDARVMVAVPSRDVAKDFEAAFNSRQVAVENRAGLAREISDGCRYARALVRLARDRSDSVAAGTALLLAASASNRGGKALQLVKLCMDRSQGLASLLFEKSALPTVFRGSQSKVLDDIARVESAENLVEVLAELTGCVNATNEASEAGALEDNETLSQIRRGRVTILTLHTSKGLEADWVFLPSVEPGSYERGTIGKEQNERRRLMYVGITRAIEGVIVTYASQRYGKQRYGDPTGSSPRKARSVFLDEIMDGTGIISESGASVVREFIERTSHIV